MKNYHITQHGKMELEEELKVLLDSRKEISERIAEARAYGDLSENAEYSAAREEQSLNESRIMEIENILQNAEIIKGGKGGKIALGSTVILKNGAETEYRIVGAVEADPLDGKLSNESPLGSALMGKKTGDKVTIKTPKGEVTYAVKSVQ
ncbi:MAG: transcription elongation factor GreA [Candidatus Nomurabacteria bacterium]|jgi:transcription elongation factor GreA|nr:transcription elongation factor GreA [Candidatus Nomurabacteria bacterium]